VKIDPEEWKRHGWEVRTRFLTTTGLLGCGYPSLESAQRVLEGRERCRVMLTGATVLGGIVHDAQGTVLASWGEPVPEVVDRAKYRGFARTDHGTGAQCSKCTAWTIDGGYYDPGVDGRPLCLDCTDLDATRAIRRIVPPGVPLPARTSKNRKQYRRHQ